MLFLFGLHVFQIVVQAVEPLLPGHAVVFYPVGNLFERCRFDPAGTPLCGPPAADKSSLFKHFQVL